MILDQLDIDAGAFAAGTGWEIKPEGACKGDVCVPLPNGFDVTSTAQRLGMAIVHDTDEGLWAIGPESITGRALVSAEAPELALDDIDFGQGAFWERPETDREGAFALLRRERREHHRRHDAVAQVVRTRERGRALPGGESGRDCLEALVDLGSGVRPVRDLDAGGRLAAGHREECVRGDQVAPARGVALDLVGAAVAREVVEHAGGHRDVGRFVAILALDRDVPIGDVRAEQERGGEL